MKKDNLNPELMVGDEVTVLYVDKSHGTMNTAKRFEDYVVMGIRYRHPENWESPDVDTKYYVVQPIDGYSDEEATGRMLSGGGRITEEHLYPSWDSWMLKKGFRRGELEEEPNEIARTLSKARKHGVGTRFSKAAIKANPQRFRKYTRDKYLKEQQEISPELTYGDTILVVDVDREVENNSIKYNIPPPELRPEKFTPYAVVDKESNGSESKHPFRYTLIPEDKLEKWERYEALHNNPLYQKKIGAKLLFPWVHDWMIKKSKINEHNQPGLNPQLKVDDIVRVIDVDGEHGRMPKRFETYIVVKVGKTYPLMTKRNRGHDNEYYDIRPYPDSSTQFSELDVKTLYRGDTWIYADVPMANKVDRKTINEHGADTSWANDDDKVTLQDILELTKDIPIINYPTKELAKLPSLKNIVLGWNPEEIERISQVDVSRQYPILVMVNEYNEVQWILDGNHRAQQAVMNDIPTIPAKLIKPSDLDERSIKMFYPEEIPGTNQTIREQVDSEEDEMDRTPFTKLEANILKQLHKNLDRSELQKLTTDTPNAYNSEGKKFWNVMKLFGLNNSNVTDDTRVSKYAKWALDNWTEDGDYGSIEEPIKEKLKWYGIDREETGSQVEYKQGDAEVLGFDEDDASERANYDFYSWGGDMETTDYGDYETYDSEITRSDFIRMDESITSQIGGIEAEDLLFNFWKKVGPTMEADKLKLIGFDMNDTQDMNTVIMNLVEYYGDEEIVEVITERLEGIQGWEYEYVVTSIDFSDLINPDITSPATIMIDVMVNGNQEVPIPTADDGVIDITLWEANERAQKEWKGAGPGPYDNTYEDVREQVLSDISILLKNVPVEPMLDYVDFSGPEEEIDDYVGEPEVITESKIDDLVWSEKPTQKHKKRMEKEFGKFEGFPVNDFMNTNPPKNGSEEAMDELMLLDSLPVIDEFVKTTDDIFPHFEKYFKENDLEFPKEELKNIVKDTSPIILKLKYHYNRPRPQQLANAKGLEFHEEPLDSSKTPAYPSGHATQGRLIANILGDKYPKHKSEISKLGNEIGTGRLVAKVHYPSDDLFGKELGDVMYKYIKDKNLLEEQVTVTQGDMLKSDIFKFLSNRFSLKPTDFSEIKDTEGNYYRLIDIEEPHEDVNLSHLLDPIVDMVSYGIKNGIFKEGDIQKGIEAITDWISLSMNQKKDLMN